MRRLTRILACGTLLCAIGASGCGQGGTVARAGGQSLTKDTLDRLVRAQSGGQAIDPNSTSTRALRKQALESWIADQWLIGQAESQGLRITAAQALARAQASEFPGGPAELRSFLRQTGERLSDLERHAKAEIASEELREQAISKVPTVTQEQIADYYTQHKKRYLIPEERIAYFNNLKFWAPSIRLKHEVEAGKRALISPSQREVHEEFARAHVPPGNDYERAIVASKPHTVAGPYLIFTDYWLYEVIKIIPARQRTLGEVSASIRRELTSEGQEATLARAHAEWASSWSAKTDCASGYVVGGCRQRIRAPAGGPGWPGS
jgi:foldase protein PrsA